MNNLSIILRSTHIDVQFAQDIRTNIAFASNAPPSHTIRTIDDDYRDDLTPGTIAAPNACCFRENHVSHEQPHRRHTPINYPIGHVLVALPITIGSHSLSVDERRENTAAAAAAAATVAASEGLNGGYDICKS